MSDIAVFMYLQIGPSIVYLKMILPFGTIMIVQSVVPEKPLLQRFTNSVYADWWLPNIVARIMLRGECIQVHVLEYQYIM